MMKMIKAMVVALGIAMGTTAAASQVCSYPVPTPLKSGAQAVTGRFADDGKVTIAYLPAGTEFNYHIALYEGMKLVTDANPNVDAFMLSPHSGSDIAAQMGMLQDVTARPDVDVIVLISFDEHALAPLVKEAVDAGKVVLILNSDIPDFPTPVHGVVGVSQRKANHALADWARSQVNDAPKKVGVLEGEPGYLSSERVGGFVDGVAGTNWKIVSSVNGGWSVEKGNTAAMDVLQANPNLEVIFAANDYMALGAALAADALGRDDLTILGYDGDTGALEDILAGGVDATTNTSPVSMGKAATCFALDILNNKSAGGFVNTPTEIVSKDNVLSVLKNDKMLYPKPTKKY